MKEANEYMKISELSKLSGVSEPMIRYYVGKGIIPQPIRVNKRLSYYLPEHLEKLKLIKRIRSKGNITPLDIKEIIDSVSKSEAFSETAHDSWKIVRRKILHASIPIFRKHGYEGATITDVAHAAGISRNTIYKVFKNKSDLFISCVNEIVLEWRENLPKELRKTEDAKDLEAIKSRITMVAVNYFRTYPAWSDMMNLLRAAAVKDPDTFADSLEEAYSVRIAPITTEFQSFIKQGNFRNIDPLLAAAIVIGAGEYITYFLHRGKFDQAPAQVLEGFVEIALHGMAKKS